MSEALVLMDEDDDEGPHPATSRAVIAHVRNALSAMRCVVSTGDECADADLLSAEQALRRVLSKLSS